MSGDIGQALLRNSVYGELGVGLELRQCLVELAFDVDAGDAAERSRQLGQRANEPEVLEHLRAQFARDPADLVKSPSNRLFGVVDLVAMSGSAFSDRVEVQQHTGQYLADLVMEVAGDANALGFLRRQDAAAALLTLAL